MKKVRKRKLMVYLNVIERAKASLYLVLFLFMVSFLGCAGSAPKEVLEVALKEFEKQARIQHYLGTCSDFVVTHVEKKKLGRADEANGIDAIWSVSISFLYNVEGKNRELIGVAEVTRKNGVLSVKVYV